MLLAVVAAAVTGCARDRVRMVTIETGDDGAAVAKERKIDRLPAAERAGRDSVSLADSSVLKKGTVPPPQRRYEERPLIAVDAASCRIASVSSAMLCSLRPAHCCWRLGHAAPDGGAGNRWDDLGTTKRSGRMPLLRQHASSFVVTSRPPSVWMLVGERQPTSGTDRPNFRAGDDRHDR